MRFVLPPLAADQVPNGRDAADYSVLQKIANGLTLAETLDEQAQQLISIPDVWAQVEVFRAALIEKGHPLHQRAVGEWRGLIAVFALRFSRAYDVTTQTVQLGGKGTGTGLIAILNKIKPALTLTRRHNWDEIGLIKVRGIVIGLLVPTTIVCPGRQPPAALAGRVPWITQSRILDPLNVPDVNRDEIAVLSDFCARAGELLRRDEEYPEDYDKRGLLSELKGAFDDFKAAADTRLQGVARGPLGDRTLNLNLPDQPFYPLLRDVRVRGPAPDSEPVSQAWLPARPELRAVGMHGILIIDPNLPQVLGTRASDINIWGGTRLQLVLDEREERQKVEAEARAAGYLCLSPDDLFTTYFYRTHNVQIEAHPQGVRDALLPLTPAVMMLLTPEDFPRAIDVATEHDEVIVTLRLKLSDIGGRERMYTARKVYGTKQVISGAPPTTLSFWPDFEHPDWHWHFAYYGGTLTQQFAPRMFVSTAAMAAFIKGGPNPGARVDLAARLAKEPAREPQLLADRLPLVQTAAPTELYKSKAAPEALYCDFVVDPQARGFVESRDRTAAGILLLAHKKAVSGPERCAIGIDFGTVNTSVYRRFGAASKPEPMTFKNRSMLPFAPDKEAYGRDLLPLSDTPIPFMTLLGDRQVPGPAPAMLPLWASYIFYVTEPVDRPLRDVVGGVRLHYDMKWATKMEERSPIQTFLAQVALQSLAEVVADGIAPANVSWRFSYPEAYSQYQRGDFVGAATQAVRIAVDPDAESAAALADTTRPKPEPTMASESLSTALYFISEQSRDAPPAGDLVTIDMGGLTSDVSVWRGHRLIWRNSLKLAGRHILLDYIDNRENFSLIELISHRNPEIAPLIDLIKGTQEDDRRRHAIEVLMNTPVFSAAFRNRFHLVGGEQVGRDLRVVAELALLGILHYVGRTMQHCAAVSSAYRGVKDSHVAVCLGGRASMLYGALFGEGDRRVQLDASMGAFKDAASGMIAGTHQVYSKLPKHEVAYGLLVPQEGARKLDVEAEGYRVTDILLGEAVRSGAKLRPYDSLIADLGDAAGWKGANLNELKAYLQSLQKHSKTIMAVQLTPDAERQILLGVDGQLADDWQRMQALSIGGKFNNALVNETTAIEPPFIVALRELIARVIAGRVVVQTRA